MVIHPNRIPIVREGFAFTQEEVKRAKGILEVFERAKESAQGWGYMRDVSWISPSFCGLSAFFKVWIVKVNPVKPI